MMTLNKNSYIKHRNNKRNRYRKRSRMYLMDGDTSSDSDSDNVPKKRVKIKYASEDGHSNRVGASIAVSDNRIYFTGKVCTESIAQLIRQINHHNSEFKKLQIMNQNVAEIIPKPLYLHIQSYGGELLACFAAVDAIERSLIPIYTVIEGKAASCGSLMAVVGKKRFMTKNSFALMHQLSSGVVGKMADIEDEYDNCKRFMNKIYDIYIKHTGLTKEELLEQLRHDHWWDSEKCLENGVIDEIM